MSTTDASQIHDLRSALDFLREMPGQLLETDTQVDPDAEVSGVYRHVGAGGTVMRPTKEGPAMVFNNVKGFDDAKVCIGMLASRKRVAALLDLDEEKVKACTVSKLAGADFVKTSTGFSTGGATFHDVELFAKHVKPGVKIKAAGGISSLEDAEKFIELGASRLGTSRVVKIVKKMEAEA